MDFNRDAIRLYLDEEGVYGGTRSSARERIASDFPKAEPFLDKWPSGEVEAMKHFSALAGCYEVFLAPYRECIEDNLEFLYGKVGDSQTIIDGGCGIGLTACFLAMAYPDRNFRGYDMVPEMVEKSKGRAKRRGLKNIEFHKLNHYQAHLRVGEGDLLILNSSCFERDPRRVKDFVDSTIRLVAPGGRYLLVLPNDYEQWPLLTYTLVNENGFEAGLPEPVCEHDSALEFRKP